MLPQYTSKLFYTKDSQNLRYVFLRAKNVCIPIQRKINSQESSLDWNCIFSVKLCKKIKIRPLVINFFFL